MRTMTYTESRSNYAKVLDSVSEDREPILITRSGKQPVVMISQEDYDALQETVYLMKSPVNAQRLLNSIARLESGAGSRHNVLDA